MDTKMALPERTVARMAPTSRTNEARKRCTLLHMLKGLKQDRGRGYQNPQNKLNRQYNDDSFTAHYMQSSNWSDLWKGKLLSLQQRLLWYRVVTRQLNLHHAGRQQDNNCQHKDCNKPAKETIHHILWE